jgi:hypothetical protein
MTAVRAGIVGLSGFRRILLGFLAVFGQSPTPVLK